MIRQKLPSLSILPLLMALLFVAGCQQHVLYSGLTEQEANEMIALMYSAGLTAEKQSSKNQNYSVLTDQASFSHAMRLLQANGLPRERFESLGDVFKKEGFVSSPLEERARLNHALSQEISHTLSSIDGVLLARVHLAVPEQDYLAEKKLPSSASVMVKHRADVDLAGEIAKIKSLVVDGVENLPYDNVTVALFPTQPYSSADDIVVPTEELSLPFHVAKMQVVAPLGVGIAGLLLLAVGFFSWLRLGKTAKPKSVNSSSH